MPLPRSVVDTSRFMVSRFMVTGTVAADAAFSLALVDSHMMEQKSLAAKHAPIQKQPPNAAQHVLWRQHVHLRAFLLEELLVPLVVPCTLLSAKTHEFKTCCEQTTAVICT